MRHMIPLLCVHIIVRRIVCIQLFQTKFKVSSQSLTQGLRIGRKHSVDEALLIPLKHYAAMVGMVLNDALQMGSAQ